MCHKCDEDLDAEYFGRYHHHEGDKDGRHARDDSAEPSARRRARRKTRGVAWPSAVALTLLALQQLYTTRVDATTTSPTSVGTCENPYDSEPTSTATATAWLGTVIAAFLIGRYATLYRAPSPHEKVGAATAMRTSTSSTSGTRATTTTCTHVTLGGIVLQQRAPKNDDENGHDAKAAQEERSAEEEAAKSRPDESEAAGATTRAVATQSQCTYTRHLTQPRFKVLPESGSGAYAG